MYTEIRKETELYYQKKKQNPDLPKLTTGELRLMTVKALEKDARKSKSDDSGFPANWDEPSPRWLARPGAHALSIVRARHSARP